MHALGIVLVHGYSGRPEEMAPLQCMLGAKSGKESVCTVRLPGHAGGVAPDFDAVTFGNVIDNAVRSFRLENRRIILIGHSTGGNLVLDHLRRTKTRPALMILAGSPAVIRGSDLKRWELHKNAPDISLLNVARMVTFVNRTSAGRFDASFPVLIIQGGSDLLVPAAHTEKWQQGRFPGPLRCVIFPASGHDLFNGPGKDAVLDCICRAVADVGEVPVAVPDKWHTALNGMDECLAGFMATRPESVRHILSAPGARRTLDRPMAFRPVVDTDPVRLNIEITTRCNLSCGHCARSRLTRRGVRDMHPETFKTVLDLMPNTYKVVLVGLGEPTLHSQLVDFVSLAAGRGHRIEFVTNALCLDKPLARRLVDAGLSGVTFSIDAIDPGVVSRTRPGSDMERILGNIRAFMDSAGGRIPTAVFTAVSVHTVRHLPDLAAAVADLGVNAWVLSDLNFQWNQPESLRHNWIGEHRESIGRAVKSAFSRGLPVLSVRGIEELAPARRYGDYLLTAPAGLVQRSEAHRWCLSPWQTLPVDVDGNATVCDCMPNAALGNILEEPFTGVWNAAAMREHRRRMHSEAPPAECLMCPRF